MTRPITCRLAGILLLLPLCGCVELPAPAKAQLSDAEKDYRSRDYHASAAKLDEILRVYPEYKQSAEAYYLRAQCRIAQSNKLGAMADLKKCVALSINPALTSAASGTAGSLAYEAGNMQDAAQYYEVALKKTAEKPPSDQLHYNYAVALMRLGEWKKARPQFAQVFQRYPGGTLAANAREKFDWPFDYFVIQCGVFRDQQSASRACQKIQGQGLSARIETRQRLGETIYMVCIGNYPKYDLALESLRGIKTKCPGAMIAPGL